MARYEPLVPSTSRDRRSSLYLNGHEGDEGEAGILLESFDVEPLGPREWVTACLRRVCTVKTVQNKFPIIKWLPQYNIEKLAYDVIAGFTIGLTVIPQAIAYAAVATLELQYGLYSSFIGCFIYCVFGSVKDITIGPTAIMSLMVGTHVASFGAYYAILLCFLSGAIELLLGLLNLGFLINFISVPVTSGFTSAAAVTIALSQLKGILGLGKYVDSNDFLETMEQIFMNIKHSSLWDIILGVVCCIILLFLRKLREWDITRFLQRPRLQLILGRFIWLMSTAGNALIVLFCAALAYGISDPDHPEKIPFKLTGHVKGGLPPVRPPPFSIPGNGTEPGKDFGEMINDLGSSIIIIPFIAILESIAIAKAFSHGKPIDASQEMIALGLCNLVGSFFCSMPVTGSFSRTAVNAASGVKTPAGGLVTGALVLLALALFTQYFYYIPKATLSAVIICAVIFMFEYDELIRIWKSKKLDVLPWLGTFLSCLLVGLEYGILFGAGLNVFLLLLEVAKPRISVQKRQMGEHEYMLVRPRGDLTFPATEEVRTTISKNANQHPGVPIIVDLDRITNADFTSAKAMGAMGRDLAEQGRELVFVHVGKGTRDVLDAGMHGHFKDFHTIREWIHETRPTDPTSACKGDDSARTHSEGDTYVPRF
ncbi:unnamed protein product [Darwinula stevensoni]|uniref:STAS domain-containing protein n=1 Tax=Darwinula stevensoni TaxID=69355 RepID=A0A7R9A750_9CRUS|nr:unnamed protein product [Darwinula stevensoni]CAG0890296.1 unnamed protein product [Darwinula stevensoni]